MITCICLPQLKYKEDYNKNVRGQWCETPYFDVAIARVAMENLSSVSQQHNTSHFNAAFIFLTAGLSFFSFTEKIHARVWKYQRPNIFHANRYARLRIKQEGSHRRQWGKSTNVKYKSVSITRPCLMWKTQQRVWPVSRSAVWVNAPILSDARTHWCAHSYSEWLPVRSHCTNSAFFSLIQFSIRVCKETCAAPTLWHTQFKHASL